MSETTRAAAPAGRVRAPATRTARPRRAWLAAVALPLLAGGAAGAWLYATRWERATPAEIEALIAARRFADAEAAAGAWLRRRPGDPRALFTLARARAGAGRLDDAARLLREVPDWSLRKPEALFYEGKLQLDLGRGRDAEAAFLACIRRGTSMAVNARLELLALYAMEERLEPFRRTFWEVFPRLADEDRLAVLTMRMRIEFEQSRPELNAEVLRRMVAADPGDPHALAGLAAALDRMDDLPAARDAYAKALALAPDDAELRERLLGVLHRLGDAPALREALEARPPGSDDRPETRKYLGIVAQARGDLPAAADAFARARDADPFVAEYRHRLAQVLNLLRRPDEAAVESRDRDRLNQARDALRKAWNAFADVFEGEPGKLTPDLLVGMARACRRCGLAAEADAWVREARRLDPHLGPIEDSDSRWGPDPVDRGRATIQAEEAR